MLSDDDVQTICKHLCIQRGVDPEVNGLIPCPDRDPGCCVAHFGPAWRHFEPEVRNRIDLDAAIKAFQLNGGEY